MRIVQFEIPGTGRRVGLIHGDAVLDLTSTNPEADSVFSIFQQAYNLGLGFEQYISQLAEKPGGTQLNYADLLAATPGGDQPFLRAPVDHADAHRVLITGTGLTHTGSMQSRDEMHSDQDEQKTASAPETDSAKMFQMGIEGGKPEPGQRGAAPEWFYKGNGTNLRGPGEPLELPAFARDGGEEPELVGCYIIDPAGVPRRLGFALGNEWSDHATERINYLYLAPSKLRTCAVGPELVTDCEFAEVKLSCSTSRDGNTIYDSGELFSGENYMCHSLANCEDHHFKYPQHRQPGDVHLHYFGTSKLSFGDRDWKYQAGDTIRISSPGFSADLVNPVVSSAEDAKNPVAVQKA
jgi:hypothetical protein